MHKNSTLTVSLCVVAYNEEKYLPNLLEDFKKQDYPLDLIEVVLIDSLSNDKTKQIMNEFKEAGFGFRNIQVLGNPGKKQSCGWNVAIDNYTSDIIIRIDAHSSVTENFVSENVKLHEKGEYVTGGPRPCIIEKTSAWKETLLMAEESMFGSSIASYRRRSDDDVNYVNSLFHGAYRREVFDKVGHFNEELGRTEDNEIHYRIRQAGYKICYSQKILSYQYARSSLKKMVKQKYGNGYWIALTLKACPQCLSVFHFVPLTFVFAIIVTTVMAISGFDLLFKLLWIAYATVAVLMSVLAVHGVKKTIYQLLLPFIFLILHLSYGIGSLIGIIKMPFWRYNGGMNVKE